MAGLTHGVSDKRIESFGPGQHCRCGEEVLHRVGGFDCLGRQKGDVGMRVRLVVTCDAPAVRKQQGGSRSEMR